MARKIALELIDHTQWPYRRGTQPAMLRTGLGRVFGQFGVWPLSYLDFMYRLGKKYSSSPKNVLQAGALWAAANYSISSGMESMGVDNAHWLWFSPAGYGGGPHMDLVQAMFRAPEETEQGRAARRRILEYPLMFVPGSVEMRAILKIIEQDEEMFKDGNVPGPGLVRLLGFKPLKDLQEDQDIKEWLEKEAGFKSRIY